MKVLLWAVAAYVGIGIYKCMTTPDGTGYIPAGCPGGYPLPPGAPAPIIGCTPACSNKTIGCILQWPLWNDANCNTNF